MERTEPHPQPARDPSRWDQARAVAPQASVLAIVGVAVMITMVVSYWHEYLLAHHNGQARWIAALVPVSIDGIVLVTSIALLWAAARGVKGWKRLWRPLLWLAVGVLATISANFFSDIQFRWLGPGVSASSGVALILISDVAFWMLAEARKLRHPEQAQPPADCPCPPPPLSLAEVLPLARERLRERGEPAGEQVLADRFGVSRHQVRTALAPPVVLPDPGHTLNGSGPHE